MRRLAESDGDAGITDAHPALLGNPEPPVRWRDLPPSNAGYPARGITRLPSCAALVVDVTFA